MRKEAVRQSTAKSNRKKGHFLHIDLKHYDSSYSTISEDHDMTAFCPSKCNLSQYARITWTDSYKTLTSSFVTIPLVCDSLFSHSAMLHVASETVHSQDSLLNALSPTVTLSLMRDSDSDDWEYYQSEDEDDEEDQIPACRPALRQLNDRSPYDAKTDLKLPENLAMSRWIDVVADSATQAIFRRMNEGLNGLEVGKISGKNGVFAEIASDDKKQTYFKSEFSFVGEVKHGFYRVFSGQNEGLGLVKFGYFKNGKPWGQTWTIKDGNAFLVAFNSRTCLYLYPGLNCGIFGTWNAQGKLESGRFVSVLFEIKPYGFPRPKMDVLSNTVYTYDASTSMHISKTPLVPDPFEQLTVYTAKSSVARDAGEGLFAKRDIPTGGLVALFNGVRQRDPVLTSRLPLDFSDYRITLGRDVSLDIPDKWSNLNAYRATLGHKCCHSFKFNARFVELYHPRFGPIMSIVAVSPIRTNQEVLVSYNYRICQAPTWYVNLWFKHLREDQNLSEDTLVSMARKESRLGGFPVNVPPPDRNSNRFIPCQTCNDHVGLTDTSLSCTGCERWFHLRCLEMGLDQFKSMVAKGSSISWRCNQCS